MGQKGYKVVLIRDRKEKELKSATAVGRMDIHSDYGRLSYALHETTSRPEGRGPLTVFTNLEEAESFSRKHNPWSQQLLHVYRCEYVPSRDTEIYWDLDGDRVPLVLLPTGTALADSVMLTSKVRYPRL